MPLYECTVCNFSSKIKTHYNRHLNTKKHIINTKDISSKNISMSQNEPKRASDTIINPNRYKCAYCDSTFKTIANKRRHEMYRCKDNITNTLKLENLKLKDEKQLLYKQIEKLIDKAGTTTIHNTQHNTQTNNIKLNSYGNEDLSHITENDNK